MTIDEPGRWCLGAGATVAFGIVAPLPVALIVGATIALWSITRTRRVGWLVLAVLVSLGGVSGWTADVRASAVLTASVPTGPVEMTATIREDPSSVTAWMAVGEPSMLDGAPWAGPPLAIGPLPGEVEAGDTVVVRGRLTQRSHRIRNDMVAGTLRLRSLDEHVEAAGPFFVAGNARRHRVRATFSRDDPVDGLVTGLLIGDTERVPARTMEDLRRAGLAHFVAVSGSNVALFLAALWIVGAPIAIHPRLRSVLGLAGLIVFVVVTRWEPSVIRASAMAAVPMVGSVIGVPADPWMALGTAVTLLLLASGDLLHSVGFQLSVAATAGVLIGIGIVGGRRPRWLWMPLGATVGAQVAVAPIIVTVFGTIPLVAPLANLVAAPVVTISSTLGIAAVIVPIEPLIGLSRLASGAVLRIADVASEGPQLGAWGALGAGVIAAAIVVPWLRPLGLAGMALVVLSLGTSTSAWPAVPTLIAFDIGQGDAIALLDASGAAALVDGGPDPGVLDRALRRHGIERLDLVVASHGDSDHAGGLFDLVRFGTVGELWLPEHQTDPVLDELAEAAGLRGIPVRRVSAGDRGAVGAITLEVLGPARRYLADNDGSVVLLARAGSTVLLPGDIEAVAQHALPPVRPDVLVVPHHGAGTTDRDWLERVAGPVAVVSYGANRYGHPHPEILDVLDRSGSRVLHTHLHGDVVVPLG